LGQSSGLLLRTGSCNPFQYFHIISLDKWLALWNGFKVNSYPWYRRNWWAFSSFVISTFELSLNRSCHSKTLCFSQLLTRKPRRELHNYILHSFQISLKI
jgi:hypothetical protein